MRPPTIVLALLLGLLVVVSIVQERRLGERLAQTRLHKEVIKENRLMREQQYAAQRQKDYEASLAACEAFQKKQRLQLESAQEALRAAEAAAKCPKPLWPSA